MANTNSAERLLSISDVVERTSICRALIYRKMSEGEFPKSIKVSANRVAWPESSVAAWISAKIRQGMNAHA